MDETNLSVSRSICSAVPRRLLPPTVSFFAGCCAASSVQRRLNFSCLQQQASAAHIACLPPCSHPTATTPPLCTCTPPTPEPSDLPPHESTRRHLDSQRGIPSFKAHCQLARESTNWHRNPTTGTLRRTHEMTQRHPGVLAGLVCPGPCSAATRSPLAVCRC